MPALMVIASGSIVASPTTVNAIVVSLLTFSFAVAVMVEVPPSIISVGAALSVTARTVTTISLPSMMIVTVPAATSPTQPVNVRFSLTSTSSSSMAVSVAVPVVSPVAIVIVSGSIM